MVELIRKIEELDLLKISQILDNLFSDHTYSNVERLGGMTNRSYKVTRKNGEEYLIRIPGEGTEKLINREDEHKSTELACKLGIDSPLLYFGDDGIKVMKFISEAQEITEETMRTKSIIQKAALILHKLHTCGEDTGVHFEVFEMAISYENIIKAHGVKFYTDYNEVKENVIKIKESIDIMGLSKKVPCHNDVLIGNWVLDKNDKLYLIDWEYSGMNEAMWDLSCLSLECEYTQNNDIELLEAYFGRSPQEDIKRQFTAIKLYIDYLWALWGLARIPYDGHFMQEYADKRYLRLKKILEYI